MAVALLVAACDRPSRLPYASNACGDAARCAALGQTHTDLTTDHRFVIRLGSPRLPSVPERPEEGDQDGDGLNDAWEELLLQRVTPVVRPDDDDDLFDDPYGRLVAIGRVFPVDRRHPESVVRAIIVLAYNRDYGRCGASAHQGDSERVAVELVPWPAAGASAVAISGAYTAAHEHGAGDASRLYLGPGLLDLRYVYGPYALAEESWLIYASRDKHASYVSAQACEDAATALCVEEDCFVPPDWERDPFAPPTWPEENDLWPSVINAGEPDFRLLWDLGGIGFPGDNAWDGSPFCGGGDRMGACSASIRSKLVSDPFE